MIVTAGKTNVSVYFYIVGDASHASPGDPITGLLFSDLETGGSASYVRQGAARVDLTLITLASASAAHSDGGFIEVDATNMPGVYRCDYPDAAFVTGVDQVICHLVAASANNAAIAPVLIDITDVNLRDSVRAGLTALPNAAADAAGGLPISDAGGLALDTLLGYLTAAVATAAELAKVPKSDGTVTFNATALASINAEADTAISDAALATAASLATAQADLDIITGADGAALASAQQSITFQPITITAGDAIANITLAGSGSEDGISFTRSGSGNPFDANIMAQINSEVDTALADYDAATGTELAAVDTKIDTIDTAVDSVLIDTNELQADLTNGGRLDLILDELTLQGDTNATHLTDIKGTGFVKDTDSLPQCLTATGFSTHSASDVWTAGTRTLTANTNLNDPTAAAIAAAVAAYDMGNGRTIEEALAFLRNKWTLSGGTLTVYDTDDTTVLWTSAVTQTAGNPVSASDPV